MKFSQSARHSLSKFWSLLTPVIVLMACAAYLSAQSSTSGSISGTVTDPAGAVIAGASVLVVNAGNGEKQTIVTDSRGGYGAPLLRPGDYTVTVTSPGFRSVEKKVSVNLGGTVQVDVRLEVQSQNTSIQVESEVATVQTENADVQSTFSTKQIEDLPNPGSDITFYAQLAPGSVMNTNGGYGNFSSFGLPGTSNLFTLNGQNDNDPFLNLNNSGATNLLLGANEMAEVTVTTNGYSGQYGQLAGAAVNYVTKSGENQFHGNARYLWDGTIMNANDFFNNANGIPRQFVNANQWADSLGGPILKNKLFFFVNNEGLEVVLPTSGGEVRIPTTAFESATIANLNATGLSSEVPYIQRLFSGYNGASGYSRATPVPLGSGDVSGPGCGTLTVLPAGQACAQQYYSAPNAFAHEWQFAPRVDYNMSDKDHFYWRFQTDHGVQPTYTDPINPIFDATSIQPEDQGQFNWTHIFGPRATNQFIGSALYYNAPFGPANPAATNAVFPSYVGFGDGSFNGFNATDTFTPQGREVTQFQLVDDMTYIMGRNTIKFGFNYHRDLVRDYDFGVNTGGELIFGSINDLYNGVLGENGFFGQNVPSSINQQIRTYQLGVYAQDDIRVTSHLKVNVAFRMDHNSNPICEDNCFATSYGPFSSLDHDPGLPYNEAILTNRHQAYQSTDAVVLEPRVGFAYSFNNNKSVLRGGAGIFGDSFPAFVVDGFAENLPNYNSIGLPGAAGYATATVSPATPGNVYSASAASSASINSAFASGGTLGSISASNPLFSPPNLVAMDGIIHQPVYYEWNLEFQQQLPWGTILSINYVGNRGIHEAVANAPNFYCPVGNCAAGSPFPSTALDTRFTQVTDYQSSGFSRYNGMVVSLKKSLSQHVQFTFNYSYSHSMDTASNGGLESFGNASAVLGAIDPQNIRAYNYGNSDYDVKNYISASYVVDDIVRAAGFHHGPNALFGGWSLGGTVFYRSGFPFSVTDSSASGFLVGGGDPLATSLTSGRPSCGSSAVITSNTPCLTVSDFAPAAQVNAANGIAPIQNGFGNQNRNQYFGPGMFDTDLNFYKSFTIHERFKFQVGAEFFNLLNHPNFQAPNSNIASPQFGFITSTISVPTSILGSFLGGDASPRLIQLHGEVRF
jgi:hypothetical protein